MPLLPTAMPYARAVAHPPRDATSLLQSVLTSPIYPTIVLICSTQAAFIRDILSSSDLESSSPAHCLLRPTLHALSVASHIAVVFTPTVSHLRAWLGVADRSSFAPAAPPQPTGHSKNTSKEMGGYRIQRGRLVVWNLVRSSCYTSEWSVQGLSESLAALIDCGERLECNIALVEAIDLPAEVGEHNNGIGDEGEDIMQDIPAEGPMGPVMCQTADETIIPGASSFQDDIYHRRLPMLNGSSRRAGLDGSAAWGGRTVEVGVVLKRWFTFSAAEI